MKYFIIQLITHNIKLEIGYIEKEFDLNLFKKELGLDLIDLKNIIKFKNKKEYLIYKEKYKNEINF